MSDISYFELENAALYYKDIGSPQTDLQIQSNHKKSELILKFI
jgi:hypothetical protein